MKLTPARDVTTSEMADRAMELSTTAFPEEVRQYAAIQVHLVNLFVDTLENERIRRDLINEAPVMLSVALNQGENIGEDEKSFYACSSSRRVRNYRKT